MDIKLTKRLTIVWDKPAVWSAARREGSLQRDAYIKNMVDQGKTDGKIVATPTVFQRDFVDQAAAEELLAECVKWNPGAVIVSSTITDI
jgi:hypothetical protein